MESLLAKLTSLTHLGIVTGATVSARLRFHPCFCKTLQSPRFLQDFAFTPVSALLTSPLPSRWLCLLRKRRQRTKTSNLPQYMLHIAIPAVSLLEQTQHGAWGLGNSEGLAAAMNLVKMSLRFFFINTVAGRLWNRNINTAEFCLNRGSNICRVDCSSFSHDRPGTDAVFRLSVLINHSTI